MPTSASLQTLTSGLTLSAWVKIGSGTLDFQTHGIISMPRDPGGTGWALRIENNALNLGISDGSYGCSFGGLLPPLPANTWTHLAATFEAGKRVKLYRDGTLVESVDISTPSFPECGTSFPGNLAVSTQPLHIGREFDDATGYPRYFDGLIDEARVYSRALSDSEIAALVNDYPLAVTAPGVLANDSDPTVRSRPFSKRRRRTARCSSTPTGRSPTRRPSASAARTRSPIARSTASCSRRRQRSR